VTRCAARVDPGGHEQVDDRGGQTLLTWRFELPPEARWLATAGALQGLPLLVGEVERDGQPPHRRALRAQDEIALKVADRLLAHPGVRRQRSLRQPRRDPVRAQELSDRPIVNCIAFGCHSTLSRPARPASLARSWTNIPGSDSPLVTLPRDCASPPDDGRMSDGLLWCGDVHPADTAPARRRIGEVSEARAELTPAPVLSRCG